MFIKRQIVSPLTLLCERKFFLCSKLCEACVVYMLGEQVPIDMSKYQSTLFIIYTSLLHYASGCFCFSNDPYLLITYVKLKKKTKKYSHFTRFGYFDITV